MHESDEEKEAQQIGLTVRTAYEVNRAYCLAIGDQSQPPWEEAAMWQRSSVVNGVYFHIRNPDASPAASHEEWVRSKAAEGWTWGPVKDPDRKEHPCMVPFDQLPAEQQIKDHLFRAVVHSIMELKG